MSKVEIIIIVIATLFGIAMIAMFLTRCPNCKRFLALEEVSRTLVSSRPTMIHEEWTDSDGIKHHEGYPAVEETYNCVEKCKYCGHMHYSKDTVTTKI